MSKATTQREKTDTIIDDFYAVIPLFHRTLHHNRDRLSHNPLSSEFKVMGILLRHRSMPTSRIGSWLGISKPNMTAIIDKLIAEEKVERKQDPEDRRVINVSLTEKGSRYMAESKREAQEALKTTLSILTQEEMEELADSLENVRATLTKLNGVNIDMIPIDLEPPNIKNNKEQGRRA